MPFDEDISHTSMSPKFRPKKQRERRDSWPQETYRTIKRMIAGGVGQNWDKLIEKIKQKIPGHVLDEWSIQRLIGHLVEKNVTVEEKGGKKTYLGPQGDWIFANYFVHPKTGVLTKTPERHNRYTYNDPTAELAKQTPLKHEHRIINGVHYHCVEGTWYGLTMQAIQQYDTTTWKRIDEPFINDVFIGFIIKAQEKIWRKEEEEQTGIIPNPVHRHYKTGFEQRSSTCQSLYGSAIYCVRYRQLGKKDIRRLFGSPKNNQVPNIVRKK
jgi:hypothetical protein